MSFETPAALWGLLSLLLLVLFSLWRQAAARTVVPSVLLWKKIPERNPPLRALRRPRWRVELLLQAVALAAMVTGIAGPFLPDVEPEPRRVALVFDTSARMLAGGRLERAREAARGLSARLRPSDPVAVYAAVPSPRRVGGIDDVRAIHAHVDPAPLLAAAREEAAEVVYFSDRPPEPLPRGVRLALFGGGGGNVGIVEFSASDGGVFARIANHGPARRVPLELAAGERVVRTSVDLVPGEQAWSRAEDLAGAGRVSIRLLTGDPFPLDDEAHATRLGPARAVVALSGRHVPDLVRALEAVGGVMVRRGGGEGLVGVGVDEEPPRQARFRVWVRSPETPLAPAAVTVRAHPLTAALRGGDFGAARVGTLAAPERAETLLAAEGRVFGALWDGTLHLSIEMDPAGWPATVSFPILWTNVVDYARRGAGSFAVVRTGRPVALPPEVETVEPRSEGAVYEISSSRLFVSHTVGAFEARGAGGRWALHPALLDPRESDTAGVERPLDWDPADPAGRTPRKRPLGGYMAAAALALVAAAWVLERRSD